MSVFSRNGRLLAWIAALLLNQGTTMASELCKDAEAPASPKTKISNRAAPQPGESLFEQNCVVCHGIGGKGGRGPTLARKKLSHAPDDESLREVIARGIFPEMPPGTFLTDDDVLALADYVRWLGRNSEDLPHGDTTRGAYLFRKNACIQCHIISGEGNGYGPELTDVGERRSTAYIRRAIQRPGTALPSEFKMVKLVTNKGDTVEAIRVNEDSFSIQVKDTNGNFLSFRKSSIREFEYLKGMTPMPTFDSILSCTDIDDIVTYLESVR